MYAIILSFLTAFALTYFILPSIINIAEDKQLYDAPNKRSSHLVSTPSLGGIGIFVGTIFSIVLWTPFEQFGSLQYILCAFIIIFMIGAKDDIAPISPFTKLAGQLLATLILVFKSDIRLAGFYGLFGLHDEWWPPLYLLVSILTILVIVNAFNLIDGIDGLAGSIAVLIIGTLGAWFFLVGRIELAIVAFATAGAVIAFLKYNYSPARIFMGDTGSLLIGLVSAILVIEFIDHNYYLEDERFHKFGAVPAVAVGIMILPLFDTLRVFITRLLRGQSPLKPDRRHIHHLLIDYGFSHMQATATLVFVNMLFIAFVFTLHGQLNVHLLLLALLALAAAPTYYLHRSVNRKRSLEQTKTQIYGADT